MSKKLTITDIKQSIYSYCKDCLPDGKDKLCNECFLHKAPTQDNVIRHCRMCCNKNDPLEVCISTSCPLVNILHNGEM